MNQTTAARSADRGSWFTVQSLVGITAGYWPEISVGDIGRVGAMTRPFQNFSVALTDRIGKKQVKVTKNRTPERKPTFLESLLSVLEIKMDLEKKKFTSSIQTGSL